MTTHSTISEQRWKELIERKERGDRCWMKHEIAMLQFRTRGKATDILEMRIALNEEALMKEMLRSM